MKKSLFASLVALVATVACSNSPGRPTTVLDLSNVDAVFEPTSVTPSSAYSCLAMERLVKVILTGNPPLPASFLLASQETVEITLVGGVPHVRHLAGPACAR